MSVQDRIAQGGEPPANVRQNPDRYYYDPEAGRYKVRPEPAPDFSQGNEQRAIPCFPRGTLVETVSGLIPIESITVGTLVKSFNELTGTVFEKSVSAVLQNRTKNLVEIHITGKKEKFFCTRQHRFWVHNQSQWIAAQFLEKDMQLTDSSGNSLSISEVFTSEVNEQDTYNLTVEDLHTYYVGESRILVHNQDEPPRGKIYIGYDPQGNPIYVGQTKQDINDRQSQHRNEGASNPDKAWKKDMEIRQVEGMDGLTDEQMDYHERRIYDEMKEKGANLKNEQIPLTDEKINKLLRENCP